MKVKGPSLENALLLMRSRYSAYALNLADYIIDTTHRDHPDFSNDRTHWKSDIESFCTHTRFDQLKIREFVDGQETAYVKFTAFLRQGNADATFTERSTFVKEDGRWLYKGADAVQHADTHPAK